MSIELIAISALVVSIFSALGACISKVGLKKCHACCCDSDCTNNPSSPRRKSLCAVPPSSRNEYLKRIIGETIQSALQTVSKHDLIKNILSKYNKNLIPVLNHEKIGRPIFRVSSGHYNNKLASVATRDKEEEEVNKPFTPFVASEVEYQQVPDPNSENKSYI